MDSDAFATHEFLGGLSSTLLPLASDFYCPTEDVTRGLSLILGDDLGLSRTCKGLNEFEAICPPPVLSEDQRAHLEATTLHLCWQSPMIVGNDLLAFLGGVVDARVNKVNTKKFSIRAGVMLDGFSCDVKVRIYQNNTCQGSIVEFQKRSGDALAFSKFFRRASAHVQGYPSYEPSLCSWNSFQGPTLEKVPPAETIAPLIEMAISTSCLNLLAEFASLLACMAQDPMVAAQLRRMPCAHSVIEKFQDEDDFRIALPTSYIISCI